MRGRALLAALLLGAGPALADVCDGAGLQTSALTGTWAVGTGSAQVSGAPMQGGSNAIALQGSGGGLTLIIDGRRIALQRVAPGAAPWRWATGPGVAVDADETLVVMGCRWGTVGRFEGTVDGVLWRVLIQNARFGAIHWSMASPPAAGLFAISR